MKDASRKPRTTGEKRLAITDPFQHLPMELHMSIISYLSFEDKVKYRRVSKEWNRVILAELACTKSFKALPHLWGGLSPNTLLEYLAIFAGRLTHLDLRRDYNHRQRSPLSKLFRAIEKHSTLVSLTLYLEPRRKFNEQSHFPRLNLGKLPQLEHLAFNGPIDLLQFASRMKLRNLVLKAAYVETSFVPIFPDLGDTFHCLRSFTWCPQEFELDYRYRPRGCSTCGYLGTPIKEHSIDDKSLLSLIMSNPNLETLKLCWLELASSESWLDMLDNLPQLQVLKVSDCTLIQSSAKHLIEDRGIKLINSNCWSILIDDDF